MKSIAVVSAFTACITVGVASHALAADPKAEAAPPTTPKAKAEAAETPAIAATVGLAHASIPLITAPSIGGSGGLPNSRMSAPAMKVRPSP